MYKVLVFLLCIAFILVTTKCGGSHHSYDHTPNGLYYVLGGIGIFVVINLLVRLNGLTLESKFNKIKPLEGKSLMEIMEKVGKPNSISAAGNNTICQWLETGYHICLIFDENFICKGVSHEASV